MAKYRVLQPVMVRSQLAWPGDVVDLSEEEARSSHLAGCVERESGAGNRELPKPSGPQPPPSAAASLRKTSKKSKSDR